MRSHIKRGLRKGLGSLGSELLSTLSSEEKEVFTLGDAKRIFGKKTNVVKLLYDLARNKWISRIERGKYLILPLEAGVHAKYRTHPFVIAKHLVSPYYIGFSSALNHHGITEQPSPEIFIVTTKKRKHISFQSEGYVFVGLAKKRFFGFTEEWMNKSKFNVSDKEKTIVDCLFIPKYCGGLTEVVKAFREKLDYEMLYSYAIKMEDIATIKRLGYILETLKIKTVITNKLLKRVSGGYCLLDTASSKFGIKNKKWRVIENIPKEELMKEL